MSRMWNDANASESVKYRLSCLSAISLLLCVITAALWVKSYFVKPPPADYSDRWGCDSGFVATYKGGITLVYFDYHPDRPRRFQFDCGYPTVLFVGRWFGDVIDKNGLPVTCYYNWVYIRMWIICLLMAVLPVARLYRWQNSRLRPEHACLQCGYDLRATPERCPECGTLPSGAKA